jgi:hypothetical protein
VDYRGLDGCRNTGSEEAANILSGIIESTTTDDAVMVLAVAVQADFNLGVCFAEDWKQRIGKRDPVRREPRFSTLQAHVSEQLRERRVDCRLATAKVDLLYAVRQQPIEAMCKRPGRWVGAVWRRETKTAASVAVSCNPKADLAREINCHGRSPLSVMNYS